MTIVIPEDRYFEGYHYVGRYTDSNETVTTAGLNTYFSLPQKGFAHGLCMISRASSVYHSYMFKFTDSAGKAFGIGGFASSSTNTWSARPYGSSQISDLGAFTSSGILYLVDIYIDDANERVVFSWDTTSGTPTLDATADIWVAKGELVA